jgi:hypothetical protein
MYIILSRPCGPPSPHKTSLLNPFAGEPEY